MRSLVLAFLLVPGVAAQGTLCDQLRSLTQDGTIASAHWGVQLTDLAGTPLCSIHEAQLFRPASNNKIFTTAAALALLGPAHTINTRLEAEGEVQGDVLRGNLLLVGAGDGDFGANDVPYRKAEERSSLPAEPGTIVDIEAFAEAVKARGIRTIKGDVVGDDTYFAWQPYAPAWEIDDMVYGYGAPVAALTIHDNAIDFTVAPAAGGSGKASVSFTPDVPYYTLDASVYTAAFPGGCDDRLSYQRAAGAKNLRIFGDIAPDAKPCRQAIAISDPAEYAALALKLALERRGIRVAGTASARHYDAGLLGGMHAERPDGDPILRRLFSRPLPAAPVSCQAQVTAAAGEAASPAQTLLGTHSSPALIEDVIYTNKVSQNQHAELLMRNLGAAFTCGRSERDGLHVVREYVLYAGVKPEDVLLFDGSGLSTHDLVTPRAMATFLVYAAAQPWFAEFKRSLPEGGVDGSLAARFKELGAGRLFAKTGTLGESRALSGYVMDAGGRVLAFSIMVDNHLPGTADRVVMDRMVMAVAQSR